MYDLSNDMKQLGEEAIEEMANPNHLFIETSGGISCNDQEVNEVPAATPLTAESLKERLEALEEAFRPFREANEFYAVDVNLQGYFNSTIVKALSGYTHSINESNGFLQFRKENITITLT